MRLPVFGDDPWRPWFTPAAAGCYVNDHCVVRGPDERWHLFGITKPTPEVAPHRERWFCHGAGRSTANSLNEWPPVCDFGHRAWAPCIGFDGQQHVMLYGPDRLRAAISDDPTLASWHEAPCTLVGAPAFGVMRDGALLRLDEDTWLLYATAKRAGSSAISVSVSNNLLDWRFVRFVWRTTPSAGKQPPWSAAESPVVFRQDGRYWLSVTYTGSGAGPADYHDTLLFVSDNPFDFGTYDGTDDAVAARLYVHAPEYFEDEASGRWYVTSAGWPGDAFGTVIPGSVAIRELQWQAAQPDAC